MVSDYFHPNLGGVESHIWAISCSLTQKGHTVVVLTHMYEGYLGMREFENGIRAHYLPLKPFCDNNTLPTVFGALPLIRDVLLEEQIQIVHCHSAFSSLAHEALLVGRLLQLKVVFTDHSLFGFADASAIVMNKFLEISLAACDHCICVSHIGKENMVLRAKYDKSEVSVIPNAFDASHFKPDPSQRDPSKITVVAISRLVYRKGIDLLVKVIPIICEQFKEVQFLVGGDGPGMLPLEEMVESHSLHSRVSLLGALDKSGVQQALVKGNVFLNTSLTEAFCIAILEAAACGLHVVSTKVGGIPEVLPDPLITLVEPTVEAIVSGLGKAIDLERQGFQRSLDDCYLKIRNAYSWERVVDKTCKVYEEVMNKPQYNIKEIFWRYYGTGPIAGKIFLLPVGAAYVLLRFLDWLRPRK
ncbi:hypothetical protein QYM36_007972, partial [Artemia franciscana]